MNQFKVTKNISSMARGVSVGLSLLFVVSASSQEKLYDCTPEELASYINATVMPTQISSTPIPTIDEHMKIEEEVSQIRTQNGSSNQCFAAFSADRLTSLGDDILANAQDLMGLISSVLSGDVFKDLQDTLGRISDTAQKVGEDYSKGICKRAGEMAKDTLASSGIDYDEIYYSAEDLSMAFGRTVDSAQNTNCYTYNCAGSVAGEIQGLNPEEKNQLQNRLQSSLFD